MFPTFFACLEMLYLTYFFLYSSIEAELEMINSNFIQLLFILPNLFKLLL